MKYFMLILASFLLFSCGGSDDIDGFSCDINDFNAGVEDEFAAFEAAGVEWSNNPTSENCAAWKSAGAAYFGEIESFESCDGIESDEYDQLIAVAEDLLANLPCS